MLRNNVFIVLLLLVIVLLLLNAVRDRVAPLEVLGQPSSSSDNVRLDALEARVANTEVAISFDEKRLAALEALITSARKAAPESSASAQGLVESPGPVDRQTAPEPSASAQSLVEPVAAKLVSAPQKPVAGLRDCELTGLADILNNFSHWHGLGLNDKGAIDAFVKHLTPWLLAEPAAGPRTVQEMEALRPKPPKVQCDHPRYKGVFTGRPLAKPRRIVDLVPFGFDLSLLEVRLLETADMVDLFVISEAENTEKPDGVKPMFFNLAKEQPRFARFRNQILHLMFRKGFLKTHDLKRWFLETRTRGWPAACLQALLYANSGRRCLKDGPEPHNKQGSNDLADLGVCGTSIDGNGPRHAVGPWGVPEGLRLVQDGLDDALIIQNDEDELISRDALWQLKHCELRSMQATITVPTTMHKLTLHWTFRSADMSPCLRANGGDSASEDLQRSGWRMAVNVASLEAVMCGRSMQSLEADGTNFLRRNKPCDHPSNHMGMGTGFHMSSTAEPALMWLKDYAVLEADIKGGFPAFLVEAGKTRSITAADIVDSVHRRLCNRHLDWKGHDLVHVSSLSASSQSIVVNHRPWAVKAAPERFCFLLPALPDAFDDTLSSLSRSDWLQQCRASTKDDADRLHMPGMKKRKLLQEDSVG
eukprot:gb/GFBE01082619.1/.p1 GENE.gb/GFBE01082619.1/~~gb/GFBE01082619.1/.p1  ORF type:complete len:647 (+),score=128.64 gb/GFBE01082619.1/:1-1941(+)